MFSHILTLLVSACSDIAFQYYRPLTHLKYLIPNPETIVRKMSVRHAQNGNDCRGC